MSPELVMWFVLAMKMAVTALVVTTATIVAERLGATVGALVATLPVSAGPVYVFLALDHDAAFISSSAAVKFCTKQRYRDLSHGLCSDRATTLDVAQHIFCVCNVARGRFCAQPRPLDCLVGICPQLSRIHRLYLHRPAILPRAHATNNAALVRLRVTSGFGGFARRRGRSFKLPNWSDGERRACCISVIYMSIMLILHRRVGGPATAAVLANAVPALAGFGVALLVLHLVAVPLGSAAALVVALGISVVWNAIIYAIRRRQALA